MTYERLLEIFGDHLPRDFIDWFWEHNKIFLIYNYDGSDNHKSLLRAKMLYQLKNNYLAQLGAL